MWGEKKVDDEYRHELYWVHWQKVFWVYGMILNLLVILQFQKFSKSLTCPQKSIVQEEFELFENYVMFALEIDKNKTRK